MATPSNGVDPTARLIAPNGLPLAVIVLSSIFLFLSLVAVGLRTFVRIRKGTYALDDFFMTVGTVRLISPFVGRSFLLTLKSDCVHTSHRASDIRVSCWAWETEFRTQPMADIPCHEVLHHLDLAVCGRTGDCQVVGVHDHSPDSIGQKVHEDNRLGVAGGYMGIVRCHLHRHPVILPAC